MSTIVVGAEHSPYINQPGDSSLPQANRTGKGYARYLPTTDTMFTTAPTSGTALPVDARHAWIMVKDFPIRIRTDGTPATAGEGLYIPAGTLIQAENQLMFLQQLHFINTAAGAAEVTVMWFA